MTQQLPFSNPRFNKTISPEQINQIVEAILAGKYSWACVLLLRYVGYNPVQYIPYRTYNRLLKENCNIGKLSRAKTVPLQEATTRSDGSSSHKGSKITDLAYLEVIEESSNQLRGGNLGTVVGLLRARLQVTQQRAALHTSFKKDIITSKPWRERTGVKDISRSSLKTRIRLHEVFKNNLPNWQLWFGENFLRLQGAVLHRIQAKPGKAKT